MLQKVICEQMSKAIYVCNRNRLMDLPDQVRILKICEAITPDNLSSSTHHSVSLSRETAIGIANDNSCLIHRDCCLLLGVLYEAEANWAEPDTGAPDGSYAIFRTSSNFCEILSDPAASRTIWYYFDHEVFVASTSQRAIVMFLGSFVFDERVIPWMLSSGSLGPEFSWDRRIHRLRPESSLLLNRSSWTVSKTQAAIEFTEIKRTPFQHRAHLTQAIRATINSVAKFRLDAWALPLSGGYDSRALLSFLAEHEYARGHLRTLTWGLKESISEPDNDAHVAARLAEYYGVPHHYYHTNVSEQPIERIIERFVTCGEGRIDHLSGYMDGFQIWKGLFDSGVMGILRGDEAFGWRAVSSRQDVLASVGCTMCRDYANLETVEDDYEVCPQSFPADLEITKYESLHAWRDRLYHVYRLPTILAALSDLNLPFVEQATPLLSRHILHCVRTLPDELRTGKALFKTVVDDVSPAISYARHGATASAKAILTRPDLVRFLREQIESESAKQLFSEAFVHRILNGIKTTETAPQDHKKSRSASLAKFARRFVKRKLKEGRRKPNLDGNKLAFRVFLIVRMHDLLSKDGKHLETIRARESGLRPPGIHDRPAQ